MPQVSELLRNYSPTIDRRELRNLEPPLEHIEHYEWFRSHPLAIVKEIQVPLGIEEELIDPIEKMTGLINDGLARAYLYNNSPVMVCQDDQVALFGREDLEIDHKLVQKPEDAGSHIITINPVYLGSLTDKAMTTLSDSELSINDFASVLREELPESLDWLYIKKIGSEKLNLKPENKTGLHPHFVNLIFIKDNNKSIRNLPHEKMQILIRMMMAKLGSLKTVIVPIQITEDEVVMDYMISGTMEGGHPMPTSITDLAYELMAFGSSKEVGGQNILNDIRIKKSVWEASPEVRGMIGFGQLMGREGNISPPILVRKLTRNPFLGIREEALLRYTRQAESAFFSVIPNMEVEAKKKVNNKEKWVSDEKMMFIVSNSGTTGAVKDNLTPANVSAVYSVTDGKVDVAPVEGLKTDKTSVEAEELIDPESKILTVSISQDDQGRLRFDPEGIEVPVIRSGFHIHRKLDEVVIDGQLTNIPENASYIGSDDEKVIYFRLDNRKFPHVGCGVDSMKNMSKVAMEAAARLWKEKGGKPQLVLVYVPNHGINGFEFFSTDEDGIIPRDPFVRTKQLIESKYIRFTPDVPQVTFSEGQFPIYRFTIPKLNELPLAA